MKSNDCSAFRSSLVDLAALSREWPPSQIKTYALDDEDNVLSGRRIVEYDLCVPKLPSDLDALLTHCLEAARASGAVVAWFGFEGSFDFEHLLTAEIADQIYAVMDSEGVTLGSDDTLSSAAWQQRVVRAGHRARSTSLPVIYADFNDIDAQEVLPLTSRGSVASIRALEQPLTDGADVLLSDGELTFRARVSRRADGSWEARSDWKLARSGAGDGSNER